MVAKKPNEEPLEETDETLVVRCRGGDETGFRVLVARYERPLYNAAYRVLGNVDDARDVTQVAFMEVVRGLDAYDPSQRFFSWIYRITVNAALNVLRRRRPEDSAGAWGADPGDPESRALESELSRRVQGALMRLSEEHRGVITLRHFSGFSYRQIAQILEIDEKTVKSRLFEARQQLRMALPDLERD
jgi:RNA polymerase sigma-70 factor (ECF subfamily)